MANETTVRTRDSRNKKGNIHRNVVLEIETTKIIKPKKKDR